MAEDRYITGYNQALEDAEAIIVKALRKLRKSIKITAEIRAVKKKLRKTYVGR